MIFRPFTLMILVTMLLACLPILSVNYIPANDYPFHLARVSILAGESDLLHQYYQIGSWLLPNIAMDAIAVPLAKLSSATFGLKAFILLTQFLFVTGCCYLHYMVHRTLSSWSLLSSMFVFNGIFLFGFYNYLFAAAVAIWSAAIWIRQSGWQRLVTSLCLSLLLMLSHMGGFALYALIVSGYQMASRIDAAGLKVPLQTFKELLIDSSPFLIAIILFLLASPVADTVSQPWGYSSWHASLPWKAVFALHSGLFWVDFVSLALGLVIVFYVLHKGIQLSFPLLMSALMIWVAFLVLPAGLLGSSFADVRLAPIAAMITLIAYCPKERPQQGFLLAPAIILLLLIRSSAMTIDWIKHQPVLEEAHQMIEQLAPNSLLLTATSQPFTQMWIADAKIHQAWHPSIKHVAAYASVGKNIYVPMVFADPLKQPLVTQKDYRWIKAFQGDNPFKLSDYEGLADLLTRINLQLDKHPRAPWTKEYLLINGQVDPQLTLPASFETAKQTPHFTLLVRTDRRESKP